MSNKPKWLQNLAEFLIDNLTVLLTIGFAGYILYRQEIVQAAFSTDELLAALLAVLALLATSEIVERSAAGSGSRSHQHQHRNVVRLRRVLHKALHLGQHRIQDILRRQRARRRPQGVGPLCDP